MADGAVTYRAHVYLRLGCEGRARLLARLTEYQQAFPVDLERAVFASELEAAVVDAAAVGPGVRDQEVLRELESGRHRVGPFPRLHEVVAPSGHRAQRGVNSHVPMDHIDPMGQQIGQDASPEVLEVPPLEKSGSVEGVIPC